VGRPKTPRDIADQQALNRVAGLAFQILSYLRQPDHAMWDSERILRQWLSDAGTQFSSGDVAPALGLLESVGFIGRAAEKGNSRRSGWLVGAVDKPVWTSGAPAVDGAVESVPGRAESIPKPATENGSNGSDKSVKLAAADSGDIASVDVPEPVQDVRAAAAGDVEELARAIVRSFHGDGRCFQGSRFLCPSEDQLRTYLTDDGVDYDDVLLAAALRVLETASLPGSDARLIRGAELHRRNGSTVHTRATPLPARSMLLDQVPPFDFRTFEPADIEPYLVRGGAATEVGAAGSSQAPVGA
jgi:hypothetical protein